MGGRLSFEIAVTAVFTALAVALGYLLASIPNVELVTLSVFVSGTVLGRWRGALVGAASAAVYYGANPYGTSLAIPALYAAQIAALTLVGVVGGVSGPLWRRGGRIRRPVLSFLAGSLGCLLTAVFQTALTLGLAVSMPALREAGLVAAIASNAVFSLVHIAWNTAVFSALVPVLPARIERAFGGRGSG